MVVASPQRPVRERNSKSLSPRHPAPTHAEPPPGSAVRHTKFNHKSIERLRSIGFPRANGGGFVTSKSGGISASEFGEGRAEHDHRVNQDGHGRGKGGQSQASGFPASFEHVGGGDNEKVWKPEDKKSPEASIPRRTNGTKRAYELALKAFQDLAREFDLPSSRRPLTPEAIGVGSVESGGQPPSDESVACMSDQSDQGGRSSRTGSRPEQQSCSGAECFEDAGDDLDSEGPTTGVCTAAEVEDFDLALMKPSQPAATAGEARFSSANACSMRKDMTRKTRHLLMPVTGDLKQVDSLVSSVGMGAAAQDGVKERGGKAAGGGQGVEANNGRLPVGDDTVDVPGVSGMSTAPAGGEQGHVVPGDHKDGVEVQQQRRPMSASHFDSSNIFSIFHERDLRERPVTSRTEYIRACAELSLSPIPVFDQLLAFGSKCGNGSVAAAEDAGEDSDSIPLFDLDLRSYGLGPKRSLALAAFLKTFRVATLRSLNIEDCGVPESAMVSILQALKEEGRGIVSLDISGNQIKRASTAEILSELLEPPASSLKILRLRGCSVSLAALTALLPPMHDRRSSVKSLCLSRNGFGGEGAGTALASLIDINISLKELDLSDNHLGGQQLAMIVQALAVNSSLRTLDLGWNSLSEEKVADALVEALKENQALTRLELGYAGLGEEACVRLSEVLVGSNYGIRHVGVPGTAIGPFGAQALLLAMGVARRRGPGSNGHNGDGADDGEEADRYQSTGGRSDGSRRRSRSNSQTSKRSVPSRENSRDTDSCVGGGNGAWLTVDMAHCCLARKATDDGSVDRAVNASAFNPTSPNGEYTLDLSNALDRHVARWLQRLASTQSGKCWVQSKLNKKAFLFPTEAPSSFELPDSGLLELTFAANRPVLPPVWKDGHVEAAIQKVKAGGDGVDSLVGVRLAETIMSLHPVTLAQGHAILSAFRWFSSSNPTCSYRLRLGIPAERLAATRLADNGDWDNFRNGMLDGNPFVYPKGGGWVPPPQGLLCIDYVSPFEPAYMEDGEETSPSPMTDQEFRVFMATHVILEDQPAPLQGEVAEAFIADAFRAFDKVRDAIAEIQTIQHEEDSSATVDDDKDGDGNTGGANQADDDSESGDQQKNDKENPCDPVEAVTFLFRRLTDRENFHRVTHQLPDEDMVRVGDALGWLNVFNPFRPDGTYRLNLNRPDEKRLAAAVMELVRIPMDIGKPALMQAFPSGAFGSHTENFVPPKTWKRALPSSGRWSFKLAVETQRTDPSSAVPPSNENVGGNNGSNNIDEDNDKVAQQEEVQQERDNFADKDPPSAGEGLQPKDETQGKGGSTDENIRSTPETSGVDDTIGGASPVLQTVAVADAAERGFDIWPGRATCREVCEKYLSWELEDDDFREPDERGGLEGDAVESGLGNTEKQREEEVAVRAALMRRQAKLLAALRDMQTNDQAGGVDVG
ncbi:Hypothetical leucine rich repeat protein [Ectocarpus siliculosus]|uniref:Hypothetical leucine rich repeat protein n=1 Tax=Ectocarpus siliculosus TaxID=2880 RepID=D7FZM5_ECTSI|nr:Hypothetical leucine rich repeat protein [Ectocarpus siliculosus]|eukprot:CBJ32832.1 Hypothetical leucine rich repeat protein [Ectocarpus siliculosus]